MTLWIDADAAPRDVKDVTFRAALRLQIPVVLVSNQHLALPPRNRFVSSVVVEGGPDVADRHIAAAAQPGDIAVTADVPLAAVLVGKGVVAIDPRGREHTPETVGERLSVRDFLDGLRGMGVVTSGPRPYGARDRAAFASTLDRVLTRAAKGR
jgi:hypothetical protein